MITPFDALGPAVLRASWQAALLALLVIVILRILGERITPRWRYLAWNVAVARLLLVTTPASPWSAFNLVQFVQQVSALGGAPQRARQETAAEYRAPDRGAQPTIGRSRAELQPQRDVRVSASFVAPDLSAPPTPSHAAEIAPTSVSSVDRQTRALPLNRALTAVYLAGCLLVGLQLLGAALVLRRRLSLCRAVTDPAVLTVLETACQQVKIRRLPALLVTPESMSPCIVGTLRPRIVVPEAIVTEASGIALRHVLVHELAHLARGDLWTNWLLIAARVVHWFNPVAWWMLREMQGEREAACDDFALAALGETDRTVYASTILNLAASLAPSGIAPAMIGLISSTRRLTSRIERLARTNSVASLRSPIAAGIVLAVALIGLTDAMPAASARQSGAKSVPALEKGQAHQAETVTLRGWCEDSFDKSALAGVAVRLFQARGRTLPIVEVAKCVSDRNGRFEFPGLTPPNLDDAAGPLIYLVFAEAIDRPIGVGGIWTGEERDNGDLTIRILREKTTLAGTVVDPGGQPIPGATVAQWAIDGRPVPGILSATTGPDGRFLITRIPNYPWLRSGSADRQGLSFTVSHPRYVQSEVTVRELPKMVKVTLQAGCQITGSVIDGVTGRPAAGALVVAERLGKYLQTPVSTDAAGRFRMALAEDRYSFLVRGKDRVGIAITDRECLAGSTLELPPFTLTSGGFIAGKVVNASTGNTITATDGGKPIAIGLFGPTHPHGKIVSPVRMATVDSAGRYRLQAAPGENFPYLVNLQGDRMSWDTTQQPAVVVREGQTTEYNMLVTPKTLPTEALKSARKKVESLPAEPSHRVAQIFAEFRQLSRTVDQTELWCTLMRELVAIGRDAVPQLCAELDRSTEDRTLRRLAFAARAIGDARAVPALIRAIPKTLVPASSDYGLIVADGELATFMQKHDLNGGRRGGPYFDFGRPVREIFGALHKLTRQDFTDSELFGIHRSEDPRREWYQRRLFARQAERWQTWWELHWRELTDDAAYQRVNLKVDLEQLPPPTPSPSLGPNARLADSVHGDVLSPAIQGGQYTQYFYDLDTGAHPKWPAQIPQDEARFDPKQLADWAAENGVDLMCVTHRSPDGAQTFVLRSFGMKAWEISPRDLRNIDRLVAKGTLPLDHAAGELLVHYDNDAKQSEPDTNAAFVFVTREGCMGLIETKDRVTRTADLTGRMGDPPPGVGFQKGVRFNLKSIIP